MKALPWIGFVGAVVSALITASGHTSQSGELMGWITAALWSLSLATQRRNS